MTATPPYTVWDVQGGVRRGPVPVHELEEVEELARLAAAEGRDALLRAYTAAGGLVAVWGALHGAVRRYPTDDSSVPFLHGAHYAACPSCRASSLVARASHAR